MNIYRAVMTGKTTVVFVRPCQLGEHAALIWTEYSYYYPHNYHSLLPHKHGKGGLHLISLCKFLVSACGFETTHHSILAGIGEIILMCLRESTIISK